MPKPQPVLYDWDWTGYNDLPEATYPNSDEFYVYDNGTWEDRTTVDGVTTTETGTLTKKEFKQIDGLVNQIQREPYPFENNTVATTDDPTTYHSVIIDNPDTPGRPVLTDERGDGTRYVWGNDQADITEANQLLAALQTLDARYGTDLA
jgi:hypothetical protein